MDIMTLGRYGIGLQLYFTFLKKFAIGFFIMSLIAAPALYSNYTGAGLTPEEIQSLFDATTLGN